MNREQEYQNLLSELENTPPSLEYTVARAKARAKKTLSVRKLFIMPASSAAAVLIVFVALVNLSTTFALACDRVPVLRELATAVSFSPSLSAAVDNEFAQIIDLEQTQDGITLRIEYVIIDQKQLNIFYTLQSQDYFDMGVVPAVFHGKEGQELGIHAYFSCSNRRNDELRHFTFDFIDDMPHYLVMVFRVSDEGLLSDEPVSIGDGLNETFFAPEVISTFVFGITLNPEDIQLGEVITLNKDIVMDGQQLTVTTVEIYPTHKRVNFTDFDNNTAWLKSLIFFFVNEKGERFDPISYGVTATASADSPMNASHRLESSFFHQSDSLTMFITGAVWLDKEAERVRIDLSNGFADKLPDGVELKQVTREGNSWHLIFTAIELIEGSSHQLFELTYYDRDGNEYFMNGFSSVKTYSGFDVQFTLTNYPYDTVYLMPHYTRLVELEIPVEVIVK